MFQESLLSQSMNGVARILGQIHQRQQQQTRSLGPTSHRRYITTCIAYLLLAVFDSYQGHEIGRSEYDQYREEVTFPPSSWILRHRLARGVGDSQWGCVLRTDQFTCQWPVSTHLSQGLSLLVYICASFSDFTFRLETTPTPSLGTSFSVHRNGPRWKGARHGRVAAVAIRSV